MNNCNSQIFGLDKLVIQKINQVFSGYSEIEKVIIYGSRAKGNYRHGSDIDLTLLGSAALKQNLNSISQQLDDLLLPYSIDLSIFESIDNIDLIDHINKYGKIFYLK